MPCVILLHLQAIEGASTGRAAEGGLQPELPDPRGAGIEADKIAAYELEDMRVKQ